MSSLPRGVWKKIKIDDDRVSRCCDFQGEFTDCEMWWNTNRRAKIRMLCEACYSIRRYKADRYIEEHFGLRNHAAD